MKARPSKPEPEKKGPEKVKDILDGMSVLQLAQFVATNPFAHLTHKQIRLLFNIGETEMTRVVDMKPPQVSGKINPSHFQRWLWASRVMLAKV